MSTLLLRLAAPMQAWGSDSKFEVRRTGREPTKSGVIGLLAAALGRKREDPIDDLCKLKFGVRVDQEGQLLCDFHTARSVKQTYVTKRYYLSDAVFLVALESDDKDFLLQLENAIKNPVYPLFLGRRSCPPTLPIVIGMRDKSMMEALNHEPWLASEWMQKRYKKTPMLRLVTDADKGDSRVAFQRDMPISFSVKKRSYNYRAYVEHRPVIIECDNCNDISETKHDPMSEL